MRFWDSSALVPLCVDQPKSPAARDFYEQDPELAVWWGSPVECASALARLRREGLLGADDEEDALRLLVHLEAAWFEMQPGATLRALAMRLLRVHPLRAADSLQLAAALEWAGTPPNGELVTFDERLKAAARLEGITVL